MFVLSAVFVLSASIPICSVVGYKIIPLPKLIYHLFIHIFILKSHNIIKLLSKFNNVAQNLYDRYCGYKLEY